MKIHQLLRLLLIGNILLFTSCTTATPEKYFDLAVLNSNMLAGFAGERELRELESTSTKLNEKGETVPMQRDEILKTKIQFLDEQYSKIKELKETPDSKEMLNSSLSLYEFVLPVYKKEYTGLAKLYDDGAPKEQTEPEIRTIHDKYYPGFKERYDKLIAAGKGYAAQHSIKVNWAE